LLLLGGLSPLHAQPLPTLHNHLGFGLSYSFSNFSPISVSPRLNTAPLPAGVSQPIPIGLQFSLLYDRHLSPLLDAEASVNFFGDHSLLDGSSTAKRLSYGVIGNVSLLFKLSGAAREQWRFGGGLSLRQRFLMFALSPLALTGSNADISYLNDYALGANAMVDYTIPLGSKTDVTFRLQGQMFAPAFAKNEAVLRSILPDVSVPLAAPYCISLGAFFRVGW
jgi:hypothetical protein